MNQSKEEKFILKEGKILWIENIPERPQPEDFLSGDTVTPFGDGYMNWDAFNYACNVWESERQSAIDNAIEVSNQTQVKDHINPFGAIGEIEPGKIYSLECSVEKKETPDNRDGKIVALVTFPQSTKFKEMFEKSSLFKGKKTKENPIWLGNR